MDHDRAFKTLLETFLMEFVTAFLPDVAAYLDPTYFEFLDKEVFTDLTEGERHVVDLLVKVRFRATASELGLQAGQEAFFLLHVENQATARADFAKRMFLYCARLIAKYNLPVYPVAILSYDTPLRPEPDTYEVAYPGKTVLHFEYTAIQLNRLFWRDFVQTPNPVAAALLAKMNVSPEDRVQVQLEVLRMIRTLKLDPARSKLIGGFMDAYLKLTAEEMKQYERAVSQLPQEEQEETMEIISRWELKGRVEGKEQLVARQIERRLRSVSPNLLASLEQLSSEQLDELGLELLDFTSPADLETWLTKQQIPFGS